MRSSVLRLVVIHVKVLLTFAFFFARAPSSVDSWLFLVRPAAVYTRCTFWSFLARVAQTLKSLC